MKDVHALTPTDFNGIVNFGPRRYTIEVFTGNPGEEFRRRSW